MKKKILFIVSVFATLMLLGLPALADWPTAQISPDPLEFPATNVGSTSAGYDFTITNTSTTWPLVIFSATLSDSASLTKVTDNCSQKSISPGNTCTIIVTFSPQAAGYYESTLSVISLGYGIVDSAKMTGTGVAPQALLTPTSADFGSQIISLASVERSFTLSNPGTAILTIGDISAEAPFEVSSETCGASLAEDEWCTINVTFTPTALGAVQGALSVFTNTPITPHIAELSGTGIEAGNPAVKLSTAYVDFGTQLVSTTSDARTVTVTNSGDEALSFSDISVSGVYAETDDCHADLAPGTSCTITITFTPLVADSYAGTVTITDNAVDSPQIITLAGVGYSPGDPVVDISDSAVDFGNVDTGSQSIEHNITLTNAGATDLTVSLTAIAGEDAANFAKRDLCKGMTLITGEQCTITVWFSPSVEGNLDAVLEIADNTADSPQSVNLIGAGVNPTPSDGGCNLVAAPSAFSGLWLLMATPAALYIGRRRRKHVK